MIDIGYLQEHIIIMKRRRETPPSIAHQGVQLVWPAGCHVPHWHISKLGNTTTVGKKIEILIFRVGALHSFPLPPPLHYNYALLLFGYSEFFT